MLLVVLTEFSDSLLKVLHEKVEAGTGIEPATSGVLG